MCSIASLSLNGAIEHLFKVLMTTFWNGANIVTKKSIESNLFLVCLEKSYNVPVLQNLSGIMVLHALSVSDMV